MSSDVGVSSRVRVAREPSHPITRPEGALSPLRNRGTPLGEIVADPARGLVYGNRGSLHNARGELRRRYNGRRWIACRLQFRGWQRPELMMPGRFTELFFLDEATAIAAGHRPCALCRREDYRAFTSRWSDLHPGQRGADVIDAQLHQERVDPATGARRRHDPVAVGTLPDGAFVLAGDCAGRDGAGDVGDAGDDGDAARAAASRGWCSATSCCTGPRAATTGDGRARPRRRCSSRSRRRRWSICCGRGGVARSRSCTRQPGAASCWTICTSIPDNSSTDPSPAPCAHPAATTNCCESRAG